jgi:hypothetical protein
MKIMASLVAASAMMFHAAAADVPEKIETLIASLGDADFDAREQAHEKLLARGRVAWEFLKKATPAVADAEAQRHCAEVLFELDLQFESSETLGQRAAEDVRNFRFSTAARYMNVLQLRASEFAELVSCKAVSSSASVLPATDRAAAAGEANANELRSIVSRLQSSSFDHALDTLVLGTMTYVGHVSCELTSEFGQWKLVGHGDQVIQDLGRCDFYLGGFDWTW